MHLCNSSFVNDHKRTLTHEPTLHPKSTLSLECAPGQQHTCTNDVTIMNVRKFFTYFPHSLTNKHTALKNKRTTKKTQKQKKTYKKQTNKQTKKSAAISIDDGADVRL